MSKTTSHPIHGGADRAQARWILRKKIDLAKSMLDCANTALDIAVEEGKSGDYWREEIRVITSSLRGLKQELEVAE